MDTELLPELRLYVNLVQIWHSGVKIVKHLRERDGVHCSLKHTATIIMRAKYSWIVKTRQYKKWEKGGHNYESEIYELHIVVRPDIGIYEITAPKKK